MADTVLRRGDLVVSTFSGDYGKPRPAVLVQSDLFNTDHDSLLLCPISSELTELRLFRIRLPASSSTGLRKESEAMVDKLTVSKRSRISRRIGRLSTSQMIELDGALRLWLDLP